MDEAFVEFDNIKNEIFEDVMTLVWGAKSNGYLKTYKKILNDSSEFLTIVKDSNNYKSQEMIESIMLRAIDNMNQMSRLNKMLNSLELEFKRVMYKQKQKIETTMLLKRKSVQTIHADALKSLKTQKEKEDFIRIIFTGDSDIEVLETDLEDIEFSKEAIEVERKKVEANILIAKEAVHMSKKLYDRRNGGFD